MSQKATQEIYHPLFSVGQHLHLNYEGAEHSTYPDNLQSNVVDSAVVAARYTSSLPDPLEEFTQLYEEDLDDAPDRWQPRKTISLAPEMSSLTVERVQLRHRHLDLFFGAAVHRPPLFIYDNPDIGNPRMQALTAAMDAFCLAQLATSYNDEALAETSRILYGRAINLLNDRISSFARLGQHLVNEELLDDIVGAICALIASAWYTCIGAAQYDCIRHLQGLNRVVELYGWVPGLSETAKESFCAHWQRRALGDSFLPGRSLRDSIRKGTAGNNDDEFFRTCAARVPDLMKRAQRLLARKNSRNPNEAEITAVLSALGQSAADIKRWHLQWHRENPSGCRVVSVKSHTTFHRLCKDHTDVFPRAYDFTTAVLERDMRLSTICLLHILQAIISVHAAYSSVCAENFMECQETMAKVEAKTAADALCMHVPWSSRVQNATYACTYSIAPLYHASEFYRRFGFLEERGWCAEVSQALSERYGILVDFSAGLIAQ